MAFEGESQERPFLDKWVKTPMFPAVIGLFFPAPTIVVGLALLLLYPLGDVYPILYLVFYVIVLIAYCVACGIYALKVYPSLTTDKPMLKSPNTVAYLNLSFGGIIFGSIWCSALTNKRQSSKSVGIVYVVLIVAILAFSAARGFYEGYTEALNETSSYSPSSSYNVTSSAKTVDYDVIGYAEPDYTMWSDASGSASISDDLIRFNATSGSKSVSVSGSYITTEEDIRFYATSDGNYAGYGESEGDKMIVVLSEDELLYYLLLE